MITEFADWSAVVFRFVHVIAGIMWIGNSLLFTWMEINLIKDDKDPDSLGYMNMLHGGGVFFLDKRILKPGRIPEPLHWFRWQSYTTWISGVILIVSILFVHGGGYLLDTTKTDMNADEAVLLSLVLIVLGFLCYDFFWRSPIKNKPKLGIAITFAAVLLVAAWLDTIFNGRAVYLQLGMIMGTWMTANVYFHIIPNQKKFMANLEAGKEHDLELGKAAKTRSLHNHYITFPVIFLMLSSHYGQLTAAERNVMAMAVIIVALMFIKHMMNVYLTDKLWLPKAFGAFGGAAVLVALLLHVPTAAPKGATEDETAALLAAVEGKQLITSKGCIACHVQGQNSIAPSLHGLWGTEREFIDGTTAIADEAYIRESILHPGARIVKGFAAAMPAYEELDDDELDALLAYIKSIQ